MTLTVTNRAPPVIDEAERARTAFKRTHHRVDELTRANSERLDGR
jgi:hypothetical protein